MLIHLLYFFIVGPDSGATAEGALLGFSLAVVNAYFGEFVGVGAIPAGFTGLDVVVLRVETALDALVFWTACAGEEGQG